VCRVVRKDESCQAFSEPQWWRNQPCASWGRNGAANAILVRLLLGPSGCLKGDFLNFPSIPNSFFHGRLQRAVTSNYAPVSEVNTLPQVPAAYCFPASASTKWSGLGSERASSSSDALFITHTPAVLEWRLRHRVQSGKSPSLRSQ
jgi:hypothetical protein